MKKSKNEDDLSLENKAKKELLNLYSEVKKHDNYYYSDHNPEISDSEYDDLRRSIIKIENDFPSLVLPSSPSLNVGAEPSEKFGKVSTRSLCYLSKMRKIKKRLFHGVMELKIFL